MARYLLDTDICVYGIKDRFESIRLHLLENAGEMAISTVTYSELMYGAEKSDRPERTRRGIKIFTAPLEILTFDIAAAAHFAQIRADLSKAGKIIGPYDMMIAGAARARGLILVTNNSREFSRVDGLRLENWTHD